jgi:colicin import membrane protein
LTPRLYFWQNARTTNRGHAAQEKTMTDQKLLVPDTALASPETLFLPSTLDAVLAGISAKARNEASADTSSQKARSNIASLAYRVAMTKTTIDGIGRELVSEWKAKAAAVDASRRRVRDTLDELRDEIRAPLTTWEKAEDARKAAIRQRLAALAEDLNEVATSGHNALLSLKDKATNTNIADFDEQGQEAAQLRDKILAAIEQRLALLDAQRQIEEAQRRAREAEEAERRAREAAELAAKQALEAERRAREAAELAAKQAAEQERLAQERLEAAERARERAERAEREATLRAEQERKDHEARLAAQAERARIAEERRVEREKAEAAEAERRRIAREQAEARAAAQKEADHASRLAAQKVKDEERLSDLATFLLVTLNRSDADVVNNSDERVAFSKAVAETFVAAVAAGNIRHISLS